MYQPGNRNRSDVHCNHVAVSIKYRFGRAIFCMPTHMCRRVYDALYRKIWSRTDGEMPKASCKASKVVSQNVHLPLGDVCSIQFHRSDYDMDDEPQSRYDDEILGECATNAVAADRYFDFHHILTEYTLFSTIHSVMSLDSSSCSGLGNWMCRKLCDRDNRSSGLWS